MFIQISTNNICQLKCEWCIGDKGIPETMGLCLFEHVVNEFIDTFGTLSLVDMTPIVGEITQTPDWMEMLQYLYTRHEVKRFEFVTNFLNYDKQTIRRLMGYREKFGIFISVYGYDRLSFNETTGVDGWSWFEKSLINLQECMSESGYTCFPVTFYFRNMPHRDIPTDSFLHRFIRSLQITSKNVVVVDSTMAKKNYNWAGQFEDVPNPVPVGDNKETCLHAVLQNCVLPNGDITLCGMVDFCGKMLIGNIFNKSLSEIYGKGSLYESYMEQNHPMCMKCSEHEPKSNEPEDVRKHEDKLNKIR